VDTMDLNTYVSNTAKIWVDKYGKQIKLDDEWSDAAFDDFKGDISEACPKDQYSYFHQLVQEEIERIDTFEYAENDHIMVRVKLEESSSPVEFYNKASRELGWVSTPYKRFNFRNEYEALKAVWEWVVIVRALGLIEEMHHDECLKKAIMCY